MLAQGSRALSGWNGPMRIEIFTAPSCGSCDSAKAILREHRLEFVEFDIASPASMAAFRARLPGVRSIPQILIDGRHIGGYEELRLHVGLDEVDGGAAS